MMSGLRHPVCVLALALVMGGWILVPGQAAAKTHPHQSTTHKAAPHQAASSDQFVDGIAAIVNKQVITLGQLNDRVRQMRGQLQQQHVPVPEDATLRRQVLQQMINQVLQDQEAKKIGMHVTDAQVAQATQQVAQRNHLTVDQLKQEIPHTGMTWDQYQADLRTQILDDILRQHFVEDKINISDSDVDAFLNLHQGEPLQPPAPQVPEPAPRPAPQQPARVPYGPELLELAQILVEVPDYASNKVVAEKRAKAEAILRKLKSGANFAGVAAASSDGPQALQGGDMGIRPLKDWPDLFAQAVKNTQAGNITGILQSGRGFHILKVVRRGYATRPAPKSKTPPAPQPQPQQQPAAAQPEVPTKGPMMVTQTHVRHILIKTSKVMDDAKAKQILEGLRQRILHGESFAELAKRYSEDASAPQGGDLGWVNPGETVPAFEQAMNALKAGQVSEPVKSRFGWHLIQVEGRRTKDMAEEYRRIQARRMLMESRIGPAYEDWLDQLRAQAYIDNRLAPKPASN